MSTFETQLKQLEIRLTKKIDQLYKQVVARNPNATYVSQDMTCEMLNVKPRQLYNIRKRLNGEKITGDIRWTRGKGKAIMYHKDDLEKYIGLKQ